MHKRSFRRSMLLGTLLAMLLAVSPVLAASSSGSVGRTLDPKTHFYVPVPDVGAVEQIAQLSRSDQEADAELIRKMVTTPQAIWFTKGTPSEIKLNVKLVVDL